MKRALMLTGALLLALPVFAADKPQPITPQNYVIAKPIDQWSGMYISGLAGYAQDDAKFAPFVNFSNQGFTGGPEIGVRKRFDPGLVIGVALDGLWSDLNGTKQISKNVSATHKLSSLESGRVVAGLPYNNFLFYVTGGIAGGQGTATVKAPGGSLSDSANHLGYVIGGGVEWAYNNQWSIKGEYRHYDLGKATYAANIGGGIKLGVDGKLTSDVGLIGIVFRN